jgi:hypothetical protein
MTSLRRVALLGSVAIALAASPFTAASAGQAAAPTAQCKALAQNLGDAKTSALKDPKTTAKTTDPVLRELVIDVKLRKQVEAACRAEGDTAAATQFRLEAEGAGADDLIPYVKFVSSAYRETMAKVEDERVDKQVGAGPAASGTTSVATKGSVPSILGFAVEHGALLREVDGTVVTFQLVPVNVVRALAKHDYLASAPDVVPGTLTGLLSDLSVSASFDTSRGGVPQTLTAKSDQLAGFGFHYQILNWRDPRNVRYANLWSQRFESGQGLASRLNELGQEIRKLEATKKWDADLRAKLLSATAETAEAVIVEQANALKAIVLAHESLVLRSNAAGQALADFLIRENEELKRISKSLVMAVSYTQTNQFGPEAETPAAGADPASLEQLPDLGNFKFTMAKGFLDGPEWNANLSATLFVNRASASTVKRLRDIQAAGEVTIPLPKLNNIGSMVLSFAGLFEHLKEEPLGAKIIINGVEVSRTGNIGLFQIKLTAPMGSSGVAIPLSVTWSNRTELIKPEKTITRFNVGMTLDFDKLFAKPGK